MDEAKLSHQYYIATKSPPSDDRARVLKYGNTFAVFDRLGDIQSGGLGEQGIFCEGTRHVSEMVVRRKTEAGMTDRSDIQTSFEFIDADEGRLPKPG